MPAENKENCFIQYLQNASPNPVSFHILNLYEFLVASLPKIHQIRHHLLSAFHHWPGEPQKKGSTPRRQQFTGISLFSNQNAITIGCASDES